MLVQITAVIVFFLNFLNIKNASAEEDLQAWFAFMATGVIGDSDFRWHIEVQPRVGDDVQDLERVILRPSLGYKLNEELSAWFGWAWTPTYMNSNYESDFNHETRLWQQLNYDKKFSKWSLFHRLRIEQRDIDNVIGQSDRLRYLIRASVPLSDLEGGGVFGAAIYDEYFYNLNSASPSIGSGPDRNRLFLGPYWQNSILRFDVGYLFESSERISREDRHIHAIASYLTLFM